MNTFYLPSIQYSLPVTSMTSVKLCCIQSRMTSSTLNKLGYNRHNPHAVAFAFFRAWNTNSILA